MTRSISNNLKSNWCSLFYLYSPETLLKYKYNSLNIFSKLWLYNGCAYVSKGMIDIDEYQRCGT